MSDMFADCYEYEREDKRSCYFIAILQHVPFLQISPMIEPTKFILNQVVGNYEWHQVFPFCKYVVI